MRENPERHGLHPDDVDRTLTDGEEEGFLKTRLTPRSAAMLKGWLKWRRGG